MKRENFELTKSKDSSLFVMIVTNLQQYSTTFHKVNQY